MRRILIGGALTGALFVGACGGGGGDEPAAPTLTAITAANAPVTVAVVYRTVGAFYDAALAPSDQLPAGVVADVPTGSFGLASFAADKLRSLTDVPIAPAASAVGVVVQTTEACAVSGSFTVTFDDADNSGDPTTGDGFTFTFSNCVEADVTLNGAMTIANIVLGANEFQASIGFASFTAASGSDLVTASGGFSMQLTQPSASQTNLALSGSAFTVGMNGETSTLTAFSSSAVIDDLALTYSIGFNGGVADSAAGVSVTAATLSPFFGNDADDHPYSGSMLVTGLNSSHARLDVLSATDVLIQVDADGNNVYETSIPMTWADLVAL